MRTAEQAVEESRVGPRRTYDRLYMKVPEGIDTDVLQMAAETAVYHAQRRAPRLSGASAGRLQPISGEDYFGIRWQDNYVWFQEMGIRPFLMEDRQGQAIPMWVEDPDGEIMRKNPRTKTKRTDDGRTLVLIFRHKSKKGERKTVKRKIGGIEQWVSVPRSYPGAPGRINKRVPGRPFSLRGGGQIARGNVGVRWRHPGLGTRFFLHEGLLWGARELGLPQGPIGVAEVREKLDVPR